MNFLRTTIENLASSFARDLITAFRSANLNELADTDRAASFVRKSAAKIAKKEGRLPYRNSEAIETLARQVARCVHAQEGASAKDLRKTLALAKNEFLRPLQTAIERKWVTKKGSRRAMRYFVGQTKP